MTDPVTVFTDMDEIPRAHKVFVTAFSDEEREVINQRCLNAKTAGVVEDFSQYHDWSQNRRVYEITFATNPPRERQGQC